MDGDKQQRIYSLEVISDDMSQSFPIPSFSGPSDLFKSLCVVHPENKSGPKRCYNKVFNRAS